MDHVCDFQPVPLERGLYACTCGRTGYKNGRGEIVPHKRRREVPTQPDVQIVGKPSHGYVSADAGIGACGDGYRTPMRTPGDKKH